MTARGEKSAFEMLIRLEDQQDVSAVERFSQLHDEDEHAIQGKYYRSLIPLSQPGPGQQYGFEVDLDEYLDEYRKSK